MGNYKKLTILHSNDMHGDFFEETQNQALYALRLYSES